MRSAKYNREEIPKLTDYTRWVGGVCVCWVDPYAGHCLRVHEVAKNIPPSTTSKIIFFITTRVNNGLIMSFY
jgi:hypothetical protein